jgi:disulfide bond formation protein DsbB
MSATRFLATATIAGQIAAIGLLAFFVAALIARRNPASRVRQFAQRLSAVGLQAAGLVVLGGVFGSLYLSEVMHLPPCVLCWWQRLLLYPQALVLGIGVWFRDRDAARYSLALSLVGVGVAIYHIMLQTGVGLLAPCGGGELVSCTSIQVLEYGYVTIPVMSLTAFALVSLLSLFTLVRWNGADSSDAQGVSAQRGA